MDFKEIIGFFGIVARYVLIISLSSLALWKVIQFFEARKNTASSRPVRSRKK